MSAPRLLLLFISLAVVPVLAKAQDVTIYRCIGPGDTLTLRDSPCAPGEKQEARSMLRPQDPAPAAAPSLKPTAPAAIAPQREVQVIYRTPPRPLYECVAGDGSRYTSDSSEGNLRWVPLWGVGYPAWTHRGSGGGTRPDHPGGISSPRPPNRPYPQPGVVLPAGGTWVRDECHALPQAEVCARLSDQRFELIRRYNSALQSERRALELEQRGIEARLANDCGN
jgi:hypothetical protein